MRPHNVAVSIGVKKKNVVGEYVASEEQLICLNCKLPASKCKGAKDCVKKREKRNANK